MTSLSLFEFVQSQGRKILKELVYVHGQDSQTQERLVGSGNPGQLGTDNSAAWR